MQETEIMHCDIAYLCDHGCSPENVIASICQKKSYGKSKRDDNEFFGIAGHDFMDVFYVWVSVDVDAIEILFSKGDEIDTESTISYVIGSTQHLIPEGFEYNVDTRERFINIKRIPNYE